MNSPNFTEPAFTSARPLPLSWASSIQSTLSHPTSWSPNLILSSHLNLGLPRGLFRSGSRIKTLYTPLLSLPHKCYMPRQSHSWVYHPHIIGWGLQIHQLLIMQFPPLTCYLIPPGPKYSPQHPILKHPQPAFLPQCQWPSFTPMQNNRQNYRSVYLSLYIVLKYFGRQLVLDQQQCCHGTYKITVHLFFTTYIYIYTLIEMMSNFKLRFRCWLCRFLPTCIVNTSVLR